MISPYGGRTHPPAIFEDLVIINAVMVGWGDTAIPAHRVLALDKNTGDVRWFTHTKERPEDTVFSTPTFTVINGQSVMGSSVYSTPIVANGVLYVSTKSQLFAIQSPAG